MNPWLRVEVDEVSASVASDMQAWGLRSYDAIHARTALFVGVDALITSDSDFARVPASELQLIAPSSMLAAMRATRGGRSR